MVRGRLAGLGLCLVSVAVAMVLSGCPSGPPEVDDIGGYTVFPLAGGKGEFAIQGGQLQFDNPPPVVHVGSQTGSAADYVQSKSFSSWLFCEGVPPAPGNKPGTYPLWVEMYAKGDPTRVTWLSQEDRVQITYVESNSTWQSLGPPEGKAGTVIHVNGKNFHPGMQYRVMFGTRPGELRIPSNVPEDTPVITADGMFVAVPEPVPQGDPKVTVTVYDPAGTVMKHEGSDAAGTFTYLGSASWTSLGPGAGVEGDRIHINGALFDPDSAYHVRFNGKDAGKYTPRPDSNDPNEVSADGIFVLVPKADPSWNGKATVTVSGPDGNDLSFNGGQGADVFTYQGDASWQTLDTTAGMAGIRVHVNGRSFRADHAYRVLFEDTAVDVNPKDVGDGGVFVTVPAPSAAWNGVATVSVKDMTAESGGKLVPFTGSEGDDRFRYSHDCLTLQPENPHTAGKGFIQSTRRADSRGTYAGDLGDTFDKVDIVNPALVNPHGVSVTNALDQPYRYKSWASGMLWADNTTAWYSPDGPYAGYARQTPVYADPLIVTYTNQTGHNYYQQVPGEAAPSADNDRSVYGTGFHLAMPNPMMDAAASYNSGTGPETYNEDCTIIHGADTGIQRGLSMMGVWRDTLVVYPAAETLDPGAAPLYLPPAALVHRQGDWDIEFVMAGAGFDAGTPGQQGAETGQYLKLTMAQGSPFAQFQASQTPGVVVAGVFPRFREDPDTGVFAGFIPEKDTPDEAAVPVYELSGLQDAQGNGGRRLHYVILYQQVNRMYGGATDGAHRAFTNWVSFAVAWDPDAVEGTTQSLQPGKECLHLRFKNPAGVNAFAVVGLPSQLSNSPGIPYDAALARNWADKLLPYAFNYYAGSTVEHGVGGAAPNDVTVRYLPELKTVGPVTDPAKTVFLLQPHQYSARFDDGRGGQRPLAGNAQFLECTGDQWTDARYNKFWISRGKLEALAAGQVELHYAYPGILPFLPMFGPNAARAGGQPQTSGTTFNLREMASAMIGMEHYMAEVQGQNSPATSSMDAVVPRDTYNVGKALLRTAKMLHMLLPIADQPAPSAETYHLGNPSGGLTPYTPGAALDLFAANLAKAFQYYFGEVPTCIPGNTDSYYYAYYEPDAHHLMLYPAAAAPAVWPTNLRSPGHAKADISNFTIPQLWDGYGTVTMLNDHHYTYGYHILAAALLTMALQDPRMPASVLSAHPELRDWWAPENWGTVVDQFIMDIAYDGQVTSWHTAPGLTYPKMEYMDQWTGIGWADGFIENIHTGHNANSPWECLQAWAGIILWGEATGRADLRDLGIYLYTQGLYSVEAYRWNTLQTFVPTTDGDDYGQEDTFLVRATQDMPAIGTGPLPHQGIQQYRGKSMWEMQMSDADPARGTLRNTYIFQSGIHSDNTYNQTPLGQQFTSTYPHAPWSLAMTRSAEYMRVWAQALKFQNGKSYFTPAYATNTNLLYAALGLNQAAWWVQGHVDNPLRFDIGTAGYAYPDSAFRFTTLLDESPYDLYWKYCAWTSVAGKPLWEQWGGGATQPADKLNAYISADQNIAEPLLLFWNYSTYGLPQMTFAAVRSDGTAHPLATCFYAEHGGDAGDTPTYTFMAYNAGATPQTVHFTDGAGNPVGSDSPEIAPHTLGLWQSRADGRR